MGKSRQKQLRLSIGTPGLVMAISVSGVACAVERIDDIIAEHGVTYWATTTGEDSETHDASSGTGASTGTDGTSSGTGSFSTAEASMTGSGSGGSEAGGMSSSTSNGEPICGNGILEDGEGCDDGNDVAGDGCQYCARDSIIFISSASYQGFALGGVFGADQRCRSLAAKAGLMRFETFRAWLSTPTDAAADRLIHSRGRYLLVNGLTVADDWDALISGALDNPIMVDESSQTQDLPVWTGTLSNGQPALGSEFCGNWDDDSKFDAFGPSGLTASVDSTWSFYAHSPCIAEIPIYCVEQ